MYDNPYFKNILLTGRPSIGKTTLLIRLMNSYLKKEISTGGFYTKEIRNPNGIREGFEIVTSENYFELLADVKTQSIHKVIQTSPHLCDVFVGKYNVHVKSLEDSLPFMFKKNWRIQFIDEIGKMECYSKKFIEKCRDSLDDPDQIVIASVSQTGGGFMEECRMRKDSEIILMDINNRDSLYVDIENRINRLIK